MHETLRQLVLSSLEEELAATDNAPGDIQLDDSTPLVGRDSVLDSLGLVNLIVALEQRVQQDLGLIVTLADDRAMSQRNSPFRAVGALTEYLEGLVEEQNGGPS